ncbi:MAG: hypothetical protein MUQ30_13390 [Anaerolineae bacterium]|nr:hypothetical protein [Anaerolineae bacterium]
MTKHDEDKLDTATPIGSPDGRPPGSLRRQMIGASIGAAVAFLLARAAQQFGWAPGDMTRYLMWGGVIGGLIGGSDTLTQAGKRLTHRDEDWLNILVSLLGMAVISAVLYAVSIGVVNILRPFLTK